MAHDTIDICSKPCAYDQISIGHSLLYPRVGGAVGYETVPMRDQALSQEDPECFTSLRESNPPFQFWAHKKSINPTKFGCPESDHTRHTMGVTCTHT